MKRHDATEYPWGRRMEGWMRVFGWIGVAAAVVLVSCGGTRSQSVQTPTPLADVGAQETPISSPAAYPTSRPTEPALGGLPATNIPAPTVAPTETPATEDAADPGVPDPRGLPRELPERDLHELAQRLGAVPKDTPRTVDAVRGGHEIGDRDQFFVTEIESNTVRVVDATIQLVSPNAYWYVDDMQAVQVDDLRRASEEYERVRPILLEVLGDVWNPGVDGDPRVTVLHTDLGDGVAGYFDARSEYPRSVRELSNEREMVFMDGDISRPGSTKYMGVLVHELQHAIHWALDRSEETWVNEGMSEAVGEFLGYESGFIDFFLSEPSTQLTYWNVGEDSPPHYGAATLFMLYLMGQYGGSDVLGELVAEPRDGVDGMNAVLARHGKTFDEVFVDWIAANYLDSASGPYGYPERDVQVQQVDHIREYGGNTGSLPPYSARYFDLGALSGDVVIEFQGDASTRQVGVECYSGEWCWWGNRKDAIDTTLTREVDLRGLGEASLEFQVWFEIEDGWDYAYVEASADGGGTWTILRGENTTDENPLSNSFGHAFTGVSDGWLRERIDLTPFVGSKALVRFEYVTDASIHEDGIVIDDIAVPELGFFDDGESEGDWDAAGFERIDNTVPVEYAVLVIERRRDGEDAVRRMDVDGEGRGRIEIAGLGGEILNAVVVVSPLARNTRHLSEFTLSVREGK